jgi:hypothetical protein
MKKTFLQLELVISCFINFINILKFIDFKEVINLITLSFARLEITLSLNLEPVDLII